ncbi:MAG: RNA methyltransferase [Planctomycetota bacterium]|nr:RNA methyltransferase [Planctomycetota bacterium]
MAEGEAAITSIKDAAVVEARKAVAPGGGSYLVDGAGLVLQAVEARVGVATVFLLGGADDEETAALALACRRRNVRCATLSRGVFFKLLSLGYETAVSALAVIARPGGATMPEALPEDFCLLAGETIQDPRNVGVIVRTADGMGPAAAAFSADSADPYCRAAVRSSTGSIFRVAPAMPGDLPGYLRRLRGMGARVIGTSAAGEQTCSQADLTGRVVIAVGNETKGMSEAMRAECDEVVKIPMSGGAHSFNVTVATGILLYERTRQTGKG